MKSGPCCCQAMTGAESIHRCLQQLADPAIAAHSQRYFRTGPGEYGEGDLFLGIRVPVLRSLVPRLKHLALTEIFAILSSPWHEQRLLALLLLVHRYCRTDADALDAQEAIFQGYLDHSQWINNWDLVDCSASHIIGAHLTKRPRQQLVELAQSKLLWQRRMAIIATHHFIRQHDYTDCLKLAELLLDDEHDLIHKAVGWMLREVGKRDQGVEEEFLQHHGARMPRTMLRYAIEKFPEPLRKHYLSRPIHDTRP